MTVKAQKPIIIFRGDNTAAFDLRTIKILLTGDLDLSHAIAKFTLLDFSKTWTEQEVATGELSIAFSDEQTKAFALGPQTGTLRLYDMSTGTPRQLTIVNKIPFFITNRVCEITSQSYEADACVSGGDVIHIEFNVDAGAAESKADKVKDATAGDLASLTADGNLEDSGIPANDVQRKLTFDDAPTEGSQNPVTSDGIKQAIDAATPEDYEEVKEQVEENTGDIADIKEVIPNQASAQNQLADREFVNSSIQTNTATFRGTYNAYNDLSVSPPYPVNPQAEASIAAAIAAKLASTVPPVVPENNDYCFVQIPRDTEDPADFDPTVTDRVDRYKCTVTESGGVTTRVWKYEWSLNDSSFTADQWAAINSGITSGLVEKLNGIEAGAQVNAIQTVKVNGTALTPDNKAVDVTVPQPSTSAPVIAGAANAGSSNAYSRGDHVHPAETETFFSVYGFEPVRFDYDEYTVTSLADHLSFVDNGGDYVELRCANDVLGPITVCLINRDGTFHSTEVQNLTFNSQSPVADSFPNFLAVRVRNNVVTMPSSFEAMVKVWLLSIVPDWKSGGAYHKSDIVKTFNGYYFECYLNKTGNNTTTHPYSDNTNWQRLGSFAELTRFFLPLTGGTMTGELGIDASAGIFITNSHSPSPPIENIRIRVGDDGKYYIITDAGHNSLIIPKGVSGTLALLADTMRFSTEVSYDVGDVVFFSGSFWRCTTAHSKGAWNASHFAEVLGLSTVVNNVVYPTAPTPTAGDDSTKVATTAFVKTAVAGVPLRYDMPSSVALVAENDEATLVCSDRAVTNATIADGFSTLNLTFPTAVSGKVRDFYLRIVVAAGESAPALSIPQGITIENPDGAVPEIADGETSAASTTLVWFSETAPNVFTAKSETVKAVA